MSKRYNNQGFSLIELLIVVVIIGIIAAIAIPNLIAARRSANDAAAISGMRLLVSAEQTYFSSAGSGQYGRLADLNATGLMDDILSAGTKNGYRFLVVPTAAAGGAPAVFDAYANAIRFGSNGSATGFHNFYTNESGVIYENSAGQDNPPDSASVTNRTVTNGTPISKR